MIKRVIKSFIPPKPLTIMGDWRELIEKEGIRFEAKRCSDKLPKEFWPTYPNSLPWQPETGYHWDSTRSRSREDP